MKSEVQNKGASILVEQGPGPITYMHSRSPVWKLSERDKNLSFRFFMEASLHSHD